MGNYKGGSRAHGTQRGRPHGQGPVWMVLAVFVFNLLVLPLVPAIT